MLLSQQSHLSIQAYLILVHPHAEVDNKGMLQGIGNMARLGIGHVVQCHKLNTEDKQADLMGQQKMVQRMSL
jgi:hypothetical protein